MFGKGALIFVVGFAIIFSIYRLRLDNIILDSKENFDYYYMYTVVHESAVTAMNFGVNKVWALNAVNDTFTVLDPPCTTFVRIDTVGTDTVRVKAIARSNVFRDEYYEVHNTL